MRHNYWKLFEKNATTFRNALYVPYSLHAFFGILIFAFFRISSKSVLSPVLVTDEVTEDFDENLDSVNSLSFRKRKMGKRSKNWSDSETDRFYEAITIVGNDFQAEFEKTIVFYSYFFRKF